MIQIPRQENTNGKQAVPPEKQNGYANIHPLACAAPCDGSGRRRRGVKMLCRAPAGTILQERVGGRGVPRGYLRGGVISPLQNFPYFKSGHERVWLIPLAWLVLKTENPRKFFPKFENGSADIFICFFFHRLPAGGSTPVQALRLQRLASRGAFFHAKK